MGDSILQRVAKGDAAAVQECLDRFGGLVWSLARRMSPTRTDAEDAVQEIFLDVWRSAPRFDPSVAGEATFVAMIARRRMIDRLNRARRRVAPVAMPEASLADRPPDDPKFEVSEEASVAAEAIERLSEDQQKVLRLSIYQGCTHAQIAEITGMPLGTVKTHIRRGLIRVRELLDQSKPGEATARSTEVRS